MGENKWTCSLTHLGDFAFTRPDPGSYGVILARRMRSLPTEELDSLGAICTGLGKERPTTRAPADAMFLCLCTTLDDMLEERSAAVPEIVTEDEGRKSRVAIGIVRGIRSSE